ncbi:MAG: sel1 repeat family protein [Proteobacteria bacterium]|nr:sel1 repeat family protein [Pseudomonadota bacterium]
MVFLTRHFMLLLIVFSSATYAGINEAVSAYQKGNYSKAFKLFKPLAEKQDDSAQCALGVMYDKGQGVTKDEKQALYWYRLAAEQGNAVAQAALGDYYEHALAGLTQDYVKAAYWYQQAANRGNVIGALGIGLLHVNGLGTTQNYKEAVAWLKIAAAQHNQQAIFSLAYMYQQGYGVPKSNAVPYALLNTIAAADSRAFSQRATLLATMSESEIEQGQALTSELLKPKNFMKALAQY